MQAVFVGILPINMLFKWKYKGMLCDSYTLALQRWYCTSEYIDHLQKYLKIYNRSYILHIPYHATYWSFWAFKHSNIFFITEIFCNRIILIFLVDALSQDYCGDVSPKLKAEKQILYTNLSSNIKAWNLSTFMDYAFSFHDQNSST